MSKVELHLVVHGQLKQTLHLSLRLAHSILVLLETLRLVLDMVLELAAADSMHKPELLISSMETKLIQSTSQRTQLHSL